MLSLHVFSPGTPVFSTNKIDHGNITEILLKVALNTINKTQHIQSIRTLHPNANPVFEHFMIDKSIRTHNVSGDRH
jgi:hypothetical protein